jgi:hypothetical protein
MNVVKVMGGLGNQLFQYAFGKQQMHNGITVKYANSSYDDFKIEKQTWPRYYRLNKFNISDIDIFAFTPKNRIVRESSVGYNHDLLKKDNCNFHGYWQYVSYYKNNLEEWRELFKVKDEFYTDNFIKILSDIKKTESISVHVRRGDYTIIDSSCIPSYKFYYNAIQQLEGDLFIFSDDIEWCKEKFNQKFFNRKITFVEGFDDYLDFELIKNCKHNINANSTFSWWAAFLNDNENKKIIVPQKWSDYKSENLIYPENWIKI